MALALLLILASLSPLFASVLPPSAPYAGVVISLSKRTPQLAVDGVVDRDFLKAQVNKAYNKVARGFAAYERNTGKVHPSNSKHITRRNTGAEALQYDGSQILWQGDVEVGTPPLDFDTCSDFFLPGRHCDSSCKGHTIYDTSRSSTATNQDQRFDLAYGNGATVQGDVFRDTCTIAGKISDFNEDPVFQTFVKQGVTTSPEFAFNLGTSNAELFLGGVNKNKYTALIIGDTNSVSKLYKSISGSKDASQTVGDGFFTVPCDRIPRISITFGGKAFSISADTFNLGQVEQGSSDCVGGIFAEVFRLDFWIVGDVFLQNIYTVFNVEMKTVGFADLA
ncbi:acid protease [Armillaria mellea]|nr:acid protease [Armillaria mellea]